MPNRYCERLGLESAPRLEDFVGARDLYGQRLGLFKMAVIALLESGEPADIVYLAVRLLAVGVEGQTDDMAVSITKAWHGLAPIVREPDGRLALDLSWTEWNRFLFALRLRGPKREFVPVPALPEPPGDEIPLSPEEILAAFGDRLPSSLSQTRLVAAVLDCHPTLTLHIHTRAISLG